MKIVIIVLGVLVLLMGAAYADQTSRGNYTTPYEPLTDLLNDNDYFSHNHNYSQYDPDDEFGIGADIIIWKDRAEAKKWYMPDRATIEYRNDIANEVNKVYLVTTFDLDEILFGK